MANKPAEAVEAEVYEADAKVDEANEAIVANEIKDAKAAVEANKADEVETDWVDDTDATNKVIDATTNCGVAKVVELDELAAAEGHDLAKGHDSAKGQFVVVGRDVAKGQIADKEAV